MPLLEIAFERSKLMQTYDKGDLKRIRCLELFWPVVLLVSDGG